MQNDDNNNNNIVILEKTTDIPLPDYNLPYTDIELIKTSCNQPHNAFKDDSYENLQLEKISITDKKSIESIKLIADRFKSSCANAWLGSNYLYGINNFKIDISKSKKHLLKANEKRHPKATYDLYILYEKKGQIKKSFEYLEESAEYGYEESIKQLGELCYRGENQSRAMYIFKLSIKLNIENYSKYYCMIGEMYYHGLSVPRDYEYAFKIFYDCSIRKNQTHSYFHLSQCYYYGYGVAQDYKKAFHWLLKCPVDLDGEVSNCLGLYALRGHLNDLGIVKQDFKQALKLFEISKSKGYPSIMIDYNIQCSIDCLMALECSNNQLINQLLNKQIKEESNFNYNILQPASLRNKDYFSVPNYYNNTTSTSSSNILGTILIKSLEIAFEL